MSKTRAELQAELRGIVGKSRDAASSQASSRSRELAAATVAAFWGCLIASEGPLKDIRGSAGDVLLVGMALGVLSFFFDWLQYALRTLQEQRLFDRIEAPATSEGELAEMCERGPYRREFWVWRLPRALFVVKQVLVIIAAVLFFRAVFTFYVKASEPAAAHESTAPAPPK